jgi:hypothetical protein
LFIEPFALPFHELVARVKAACFQPSDLVAAAADVGLSLDERVGDATRHRQIGPMEPRQLNENFLQFKRDDLPPAFLFLGMGESRASMRPYSDDEYQPFLTDAIRWQMHDAEELADQITG